MEVRFGDYRITSDKYNYVFQEFKGVTLGDDGKEKDRWDTWGYWGTLNQLTRALPDCVMRRSNGNLAEAVVEAKEIGKALETALTQGGYQE